MRPVRWTSSARRFRRSRSWHALDQLLGLLRDLLVLSVDGSEELLLHSLPGEADNLRQLAKQFGIETLLALVQIVDQTMARLRFVQQPRILVEIALVRMCRIADLQVVAQVVQALRAGNLGSLTLNVPALGVAMSAPALVAATPAATGAIVSTAAEPAQKKNEVASPASLSLCAIEEPHDGHTSNQVAAVDASDSPPESDSESPETVALPILPAANEAQLLAAWRTTLAERTDILSDNAREATPSVANGQLVLTFAKRYNFRKQSCERGTNLQQLEQWLEERIGRRVKIVTALSNDPEPVTTTAPTTVAVPSASSRQRQQEIAQHRWLKKRWKCFLRELSE